MKIIAGPCVVEDYDTLYEIAKTLKEGLHQEIDFYFKASFTKANRSKLESFTGIGNDDAIKLLKRIKQELDLKICTDVHSYNDAWAAHSFADIIQIPAFLCRQTELIVAASKAGKIVNIKKGQFMSPESMKFSCEKAVRGNAWVTERGTTFGYNDLVVDSTSIPRIKSACGVPVLMDATHSLQRPNDSSGITQGHDKSLSRTLMRQAVVSGADGIFFECHTNPSESKSDKETILPIGDAIKWANEAFALYQYVKTL